MKSAPTTNDGGGVRVSGWVTGSGSGQMGSELHSLVQSSVGEEEQGWVGVGGL